MSYRADDDLNFLRQCTADDLEPLVRYLTTDKDGSRRLTESLTGSEPYKQSYPAHDYYWDLIAAELQTFGANSIATVFRGGEGVLYREILTNVCDKMKVNHNPKSSVELIEQNLLMKLLTDSLERMDDAAKRQLVDALKLNTTSLTGPAIATALQFGIQAGGFASYQLAVIVANAVANAVLGHGLSLGLNAALTRAIGIAAGPIGWVVTGLWTVASLAGPAYRVTIPAVVHIAFLRAKLAQGKGAST